WLWWTLSIVGLLGATGLGYYAWRRSQGYPMFGDDDTPPEYGDVIDV
ncbi:hypothetical protein LCGC14_1343100, partial [marine sediment metagenome]